MNIRTRLTNQEWDILNNNIDCFNARCKTSVVYLFLYNRINNNEGVFKESLKDMHIKWNHHAKKKNKTCLANFKKIVNRLIDLGMILVDKSSRKNSYYIPVADLVAEKVAEKVADDVNITHIEKTSLETSESTLDCRLIDNNNTINTKANKKGHKILNKKELRHIASKIMDSLNINKNDFVRKVVFNKLRNSKIQIKWFGAVKYIHKIIQEKLLETTITTSDINNSIMINLGLDVNKFDNYQNTKKLNFNNFEAREYDYDDLEKRLLGWV